jgi:hypothetical protein
MGSGIAKQIKERWPAVYEAYLSAYKDRKDEILRNCSSFEHMPDVSETLLGTVQMVPINEDQMVVNLFAQNNYGYDGKRYTSYDAFYEALETLRDTTLPGSSYAFPYRIGSDRGGANWKVIETMIDEVFKDREVYIYQLEG